MTEIKFAMSVDIDDPKAVKACAAFFAALAEGESQEKVLARQPYEHPDTFLKRSKLGLTLEEYAQAVAKEEASKNKKTTKKPTAVKVEEVKQQEEGIAKATAEEIKKELEEAKTKNTSGITIDQVRKMVQEKAKDHKTAMVAKLKEYGVPNVTKLGPAHYEEFMTFLKALD